MNLYSLIKKLRHFQSMSNLGVDGEEWKLQIGFQDVALIPPQASFFTTCHKNVVLVSKGMFPLKYF